MKNKNLIFGSICLLSTILICSCNQNSSANKGYDNRDFDISINQDSSLIVHTSKVENSYLLTISGNGEAIDYQSKEKVPWYAISKRINKVLIYEGITNIGDYYFYSLNLEEYVLPSSVCRVGDNSFNPSSTIFTYGSSLNNIDSVYYYSETKPDVYDKYFHLVDGEIRIWNNPNVLFVGNSFTFRQGTAENPSVPLYFKRIAENLSQDVEIDYVLKGSHSLSQFASSTDELGAILLDKLKCNDYDYIILQEQSVTPINNYDSFLNAVKQINSLVETYQKNCKVYLYETWGSLKGLESTSYKTIKEMEEGLKKAYEEAALEIEAKVIYVGTAFTYTYENYSSIKIYADDNRHQSNLGAYLSAAVHVKTLFNYSLNRCTDYCSLDVESCKTLLNIVDNII